jgi:fructan beta-fructosidase
MTVPRELALRTACSGDLQLVSLPAVELQALRGRNFRVGDRSVSDSSAFPVVDGIAGGAFEVVVEVELGSASEFGLIVRNEREDRTVVGYDVAARKAFVDRRHSGATDFSRHFPRPRDSATLLLESNLVRFHIFVDWSSIEVFVNGGDVVMTDLIFPHAESNRLEFYAKNGDVRLVRGEVWELDSVWTG